MFRIVLQVMFWNLYCLHNGFYKKISQEKNGLFQTLSCPFDVISSSWQFIEIEWLVNVQLSHSSWQNQEHLQLQTDHEKIQWSGWIFIIIIITFYLPSLQMNDLIRGFIQKKKKIPCVLPLTNWLPILESLGQVAGLIVMKISVMLK